MATGAFFWNKRDYLKGLTDIERGTKEKGSLQTRASDNEAVFLRDEHPRRWFKPNDGQGDVDRGDDG